jgi:hypothetical protein
MNAADIFIVVINLVAAFFSFRLGNNHAAFAWILCTLYFVQYTRAVRQKMEALSRLESSIYKIAELERGRRERST